MFFARPFCRLLQNVFVGCCTYIFALQLPTFLFYNKQTIDRHRGEYFDWLKLSYMFSHSFDTLSGKHYIYRSNEINNKCFSFEIFEDKFISGCKYSLCIINNGKAQNLICIETNDDSEEDTDNLFKRLDEYENMIK
jgi:hypothetical protein